MLKLLTVSLLFVLAYGHPEKPDFGDLTDEHIYYINNIADTTWKVSPFYILFCIVGYLSSYKL